MAAPRAAPHRPGRLLHRPRRDVPILLLVVGVLLAAGLLNRAANRDVAAASTGEAVLGTMEADFAVSHTAVEEFVSGDTDVDVGRDIRGNQSKAAVLCRTLRDGGPLARQGHVEPVADAAAGAHITVICRRMSEFRPLTEARIAHPKAQRSGSPADQRYDQRFTAILDEADALRNRL